MKAIERRPRASGLIVALLLCASAAAAAADDAPNIIFDAPGTKVFALKLPYGTKDPAAGSEMSGGAGHTTFRELYDWFVGHPAGGSVLTYGGFDEFKSAVAQSWTAQGDKKVRQVVVLLSAHGSDESISAWDGTNEVTWVQLTSFLEGVRARMDESNTHARLVVISDACHSGQLWRRMRSSSKLHTWSFLAGANADQVATTDLLPQLRGVLRAAERAEKPSDPKWKTTWRVVYEALKKSYGGWRSDGKGVFWNSAFYADSGMDAPLWTPPDLKTKPAKTADAPRAELACAECAGGVCRAQ